MPPLSHSHHIQLSSTYCGHYSMCSENIHRDAILTFYFFFEDCLVRRSQHSYHLHHRLLIWTSKLDCPVYLLQGFQQTHLVSSMVTYGRDLIKYVPAPCAKFFEYVKKLIARICRYSPAVPGTRPHNLIVSKVNLVCFPCFIAKIFYKEPAIS